MATPMYKKLLLTAYLLIGVDAYSSNNKIFYSSIRQSGTHLLQKCIELLTGRQEYWIHGLDGIWHHNRHDYNAQIIRTRPSLLKGTTKNFVGAHMPFSQKFSSYLGSLGYKKLFIYRDPRDQVVSRTFAILKRPDEFPREAKKNTSPAYFGLLLMEIINQVPHRYGRYMPWKDDPTCCAIKFEDLIGPDGGGSQQAQVKAIRKIAKHIGVRLTPKILETCKKNIFGGTFTFRKGQIGSWKKYLGSKHKEVFKKVAGKLLIDLGYETNYAW